MKARASERVHLIAIVLVTRRVVRSGDQGMAMCVGFVLSVPVGWMY